MSTYIEGGRLAARACVLACTGMLLTSTALASDSPHAHHGVHDHSVARPDLHAPIGVMGDHLHAEGEWMLSYRYMKMHMDGNRDGTKRKSQGDVLDDFIVSPIEMDMEMHMLGVMYAPSDLVTLMFMVPFVKISMDHINRMDADFTTKSAGLGDISATALVHLWSNENRSLHLNAGLRFPTGSISAKDENPASGGEDVVLPYPMQIGTGTLDLLPGATYNAYHESFSYGAQVRGTIRLGQNKQNYRRGNDYLLTGWGAYKLSDWMSAGLRMQFQHWFNYKGADDRLGGLMGRDAEDTVPTADPDRRAGKQLELGPSINLVMPKGPLQNVRLAVEALFPLVRDLDGPQLETDWTLIAGVQYAF